MYRIFFVIFLIGLSESIGAQNVGIGTASPHASAILDISANTKGILIPRMTTAEMKAIVNPSVGLLVFNTDSPNGFFSYSGSAWIPLSSQLEQITEAGKTGWRLLGWNSGYFGNIGFAAIDLSYSDGTVSAFSGATGRISFSTGYGTRASGDYSTAMGYSTTASGDNSMVTGLGSRASGYISLAMGQSANASGNYSIAMGTNAEAVGIRSISMGEFTYTGSSGSMAVGRYNSDGGNPDNWVEGDPLFMIGNGTNHENRRNAMTVLKNGNTGIGIQTPVAPLHVSSRLVLERPTGGSASTAALEWRSNGIYRGGLGWDVTAGRFFFFDGESNSNTMFINNGRIGIQRDPATNTLEINGNASKSSAGDWLANSDARLKKDIQPLQGALKKLLQLNGITYQWNDDKTGTTRPPGTQMGFTAQNIQKVFPELVSTDAQGFLQTAYGTYDALYVEAIKDLLERINMLEKRLAALEK
jgi:trimeric autotransporter adhesin